VCFRKYGVLKNPLDQPKPKRNSKYTTEIVNKLNSKSTSNIEKKIMIE